MRLHDDFSARRSPSVLDSGYFCAGLDAAWSVCLCVRHDREAPIEMPLADVDSREPKET